jgi:threonyl-tRNA synthetase
LVLGEKERTSEKLAVTEWDGTIYTSETRFVSVDDFAEELRRNIQNKV